ncbi:MAG: hypothetical protein ABR569_01915 [Gaiellaceae bacterium]
MEQFVYLGETVWRVASASALDPRQYLGELRDVPRGPLAPGDWFVLAVDNPPRHRRLTLVAVDSLRPGLPAVEPNSGTKADRRPRRLLEVAGLLRRAQRRSSTPKPGGAAPPSFWQLRVGVPLVSLTSRRRPVATSARC